jgi:diguanylate cyclase (GGDEF)-like protein
LGRLGGDEFAALIGPISNRAEIAEIAHRLEHCFDEPFILDGTLRHGSASLGISLYPEDGATKDDLLNAADAQMYAAKDRHRQIA